MHNSNFFCMLGLYMRIYEQNVLNIIHHSIIISTLGLFLHIFIVFR